MIPHKTLIILFCIVGDAFISLGATNEASTTYVLRNGVGRIKWKIDITVVADLFVDVLSPMNKTIFRCYGKDPNNIALEFEGKVAYTGDYNNGIIAFSVFNANEEDGGNYRSAIDLTSKVVGSQLLVVFAPFPKPTILATRNANELVNSSLTLTCQMETRGTPSGHSIPVSYTWRRNGEVVKNNTKYIIKHFELRISYLQRSDSKDTFTCLAFNEYDAMSPESTALEISKYYMYIERCEVSCIHGYCSNEGGEFRCVCKQGWTGSSCSTAVNQCLSEPCVNGMCFVKLKSSIGYYCTCNEGWSGTNCTSGAPANIASSTNLTAGVAATGSIIIACFVLAFGILYRKYKSRLHRRSLRNGEDMEYHGVNRMLSGEYCTIDDEQLYDIRMRVKSDVSVKANNHLSCDGSNKESPCFDTEIGMESVMDGVKPDSDGSLNPSEIVMESVMDGVKPDSDGSLNPSVSVLLNRVLEKETAQGNSTTTP